MDIQDILDEVESHIQHLNHSFQSIQKTVSGFESPDKIIQKILRSDDFKHQLRSLIKLNLEDERTCDISIDHVNRQTFRVVVDCDTYGLVDDVISLMEDFLEEVGS